MRLAANAIRVGALAIALGIGAATGGAGAASATPSREVTSSPPVAAAAKTPAKAPAKAPARAPRQGFSVQQPPACKKYCGPGSLEWCDKVTGICSSGW